MKLFNLSPINRAVLMSISLGASALFTVSAHAATIQPLNNTTQAGSKVAVTSSTDGIMALVNDKIILRSDLINAINQTRARAQAAGQPLANSPQLQADVLNALILKELQLSLVARSGFKPDDAAINQRLTEIAQSQGSPNLSAFQQALDANQPGSYAALRNELIEDTAIQSVQQRQVARRVRISEQDVDAFLSSPEAKRLDQSEYQTVHVRVPYIDDYSRLSVAQREEALKVAQGLRQRLQGPNVDVTAAIQASQAGYSIPLQGGDMGYNKAAALPVELAGEITSLDVGGVSSPILTPEGIDVVKLVNKRSNNQVVVPQWNTRHILVKIDELQTENLAEQRINDLYEQLRQGADFSGLAATYSDDAGSAGRGGSLNWVSEEEMIAPFEAVMKRTSVGDYSAPFKTQFGWHILKVEGTRQQDVTSEARREMARQALFQRLAPQATEDWLQEIRASAYVQVMD